MYLFHVGALRDQRVSHPLVLESLTIELSLQPY